MNIVVTVHYCAQARAAAGANHERVELPAPASMDDLLRRVSTSHADLGPLLHGTSSDRAPLLIFIGDRQARPHDPGELRNGDQITLLPPISGG